MVLQPSTIGGGGEGAPISALGGQSFPRPHRPRRRLGLLSILCLCQQDAPQEKPKKGCFGAGGGGQADTPPQAPAPTAPSLRSGRARERPTGGSPHTAHGRSQATCRDRTRLQVPRLQTLPLKPNCSPVAFRRTLQRGPKHPGEPGGTAGQARGQRQP